MYLAGAAGLGFGAFFVLYSNVGDHAGMWPLLVSRWTSATLLVLVFRVHPIELGVIHPRGSALPLIVGAGLFDAAANGFFLAASRRAPLHRRRGQLALPGEHGALRACGVLHERFHRTQVIGLGIAAVGVVLIAIG